MNPKYKTIKKDAASQKRELMVEKHKYLFELMKHMTTLSSGSVLLLITFLDKILHGKEAGTSVIFAFIGFLVSIIFALLTMLALATSLGKIEEEDRFAFVLFAVGALLGFCAGIAALLITCINY